VVITDIFTKNTFNEVLEKELYTSLFPDFPKSIKKIFYFLLLKKEISENLENKKVNKALIHI
jgi:hypothetical protein